MGPQPFQISIPDPRIADLKTRLSLASFPSELDDAGWDYGAPLADIKRLTSHWKDEFDWRKAEKQLNETLPQFTTEVTADGFEALTIHFVHQRSDIRNAIPLLFIHGWPGSFIEISKILHELVKSDEKSPAFHVVAISLPNFGFSEGSRKRGFGLSQYAETANKLMLQLGYEEYVAGGGTFGFVFCQILSHDFPQHCKVDMNAGLKRLWIKQPILALQHVLFPESPNHSEGIRRSQDFENEVSTYYTECFTKPQNIGYALQDSPVALLAWIYEKLHDWTESHPWTDDEICTWVSIYWFSTAGPAASGRIYHEYAREGSEGPVYDGKIGLSPFSSNGRILRRSGTHTLEPVLFQNEHEQGGHFAAWERPRDIVDDLRIMFKRKGSAYNVIKGKSGYAT